MKRESPVVDGLNTTFTALAQKLGCSRQAAQQKYTRVKLAKSEITLADLTERHQAPAVAQRKEINQLVYHRAQILSHALQHGVTHTALKYDIPRAEVDALLKTVK